MGRAAVFGQCTEKELVDHVLTLEARGFGLTQLELRQLAFKYATANEIPNNFCKETEIAGYDWLQGFLKRHPELSLRKPEALSLGRASGMNKVKVQKYFELLQETLNQNDLMNKPEYIYNVDETGVTEVHKPPKVIAGKGKRNVYSVTSGEKGTTTTAVCCVNASGDYIPPMLIFKGRRASPGLKKGAPPGAVIALSDSGWINSDLFYDWIVHFNAHRKKSADGKTLLILDGHASHLTLKLMKYTQEQGIILLCLPSKCTHWLQPLDKSVYKPLKTNYAKVCSHHMRSHPGERITRYAITELFTKAYLQSATMQNAISGFRSSGVCPFNPQEIPESAFLAAMTTDCVQLVTESPDGLPASQSARPLQEIQLPQSEATNDIGDADTTGEVASDKVHQPEGDEPEPAATIELDIVEVESEIGVSIAPERESGDIDSLLQLVGLKPVPSHPQANLTTPVNPENVHITFSDIVPLPQAGARASRKRKPVDSNARVINLVSSIDDLEAKSVKSNNSQCKKLVAAPKTSSKQPKCRKVHLQTKGDTLRTDYCSYCGGYYYDDHSDDDDWVKCKTCPNWFHETCSGFSRGKLVDICSECKWKKCEQ